MLQGKNILITAGPTREAIDPVRYISNHSSGKMGYAIADVCLQQGANVTLVSGPVNISLEHENLKMVQVQSANEMYLACCRYFEEADMVVFAAAVADYRPAIIAQQKIKKSDEEFFIRMVKNIDIAYEFGKIKQPYQLSVGFALETTNELQHAIGKLEKKNFDMVVLNSMNDVQAGFGFDTNKISIIRKDQTRVEFDLKLKSEVAIDIVNEAARLYQAKVNFVQSLV